MKRIYSKHILCLLISLLFYPPMQQSASVWNLLGKVGHPLKLGIPRMWVSRGDLVWDVGAMHVGHSCRNSVAQSQSLWTLHTQYWNAFMAGNAVTLATNNSNISSSAKTDFRYVLTPPPPTPPVPASNNFPLWHFSNYNWQLLFDASVYSSHCWTI